MRIATFRLAALSSTISTRPPRSVPHRLGRVLAGIVPAVLGP